ncbi:MAG: MFS transporter [Clostridiales bacterium]|nr:MFS transporter [Clostridiales bacterium]
MTGYVLQAIGYGIVQFFGTNLIFMIIGLAIKGVALATAAGLLIPMIGDVIEYGERKTGKRLDRLTNAVATCGIKIGTGLGAALVGWMLAWGNYVANAAVQAGKLLSAQIIPNPE